MTKQLQWKNTLLPLVFLLITTLLLSSCKKESELQNRWKFSERSKLELADFRGTPGMWDEFDAATFSGYNLDYDAKVENGKLVLVFTSYAFFDATESWFRKDSKTERLLQHEQLHFYVSEICCRILKQKLTNYAYTKNYEEEIEHIYLMSYSDLFGWQHDYDKESEHSLNKEGQKHWEEFVVQKMQELSAFASETITVKTNVPMSEGELNINKIVLQAPE